MKINLILKISLLFFLSLSIIFLSHLAYPENTGEDDGEGVIPQIKRQVIAIACEVFKILFYLSTAIASLFIIISGVKYMTSESSEGRYEARDRIIYAIVGLIIVVIACPLVNYFIQGTQIEEVPADCCPILSFGGGELTEPTTTTFMEENCDDLGGICKFSSTACINYCQNQGYGSGVCEPGYGCDKCCCFCGGSLPSPSTVSTTIPEICCSAPPDCDICTDCSIPGCSEEHCIDCGLEPTPPSGEATDCEEMFGFCTNAEDCDGDCIEGTDECSAIGAECCCIVGDGGSETDCSDLGGECKTKEECTTYCCNQGMLGFCDEGYSECSGSECCCFCEEGDSEDCSDFGGECMTEEECDANCEGWWFCDPSQECNSCSTGKCCCICEDDYTTASGTGGDIEFLNFEENDAIV